MVTNKEMITPENVSEHSGHYKNCTDEEIKKNALNIVKSFGVNYDQDIKSYVISYEEISFKVNWSKEKKGFLCECGSTNCAHILALFMQLKIWNSEKKFIKLNDLNNSWGN